MARWRVDACMPVARLAYDDDGGADRGSALDEESHEEGSDPNPWLPQVVTVRITGSLRMYAGS
jgi:hypothetical protein